MTSNLGVLNSRRLNIKSRNHNNSYKVIMKGIDETTLVYSDRPDRTAFATRTKDLINSWDDIFSDSNPNGVFNFYSQGKPVRVVGELFKPNLVIDKKKLKFRINFSKDQELANFQINNGRNYLSGKLSAGEHASLFLDDWFTSSGVKSYSKIIVANNTGDDIKVLPTVSADGLIVNETFISDGEKNSFRDVNDGNMGYNVNDYDIKLSIKKADSESELMKLTAASPALGSRWMKVNQKKLNVNRCTLTTLPIIRNVDQIMSLWSPSCKRKEFTEAILEKGKTKYPYQVTYIPPTVNRFGMFYDETDPMLDGYVETWKIELGQPIL